MYYQQTPISGGPDPIPPKIRMMIEAEYPVLIGKDTFTKKSKLLAEVQQDAAEFGYSLSLPTIQAQEERIRVLEEALEYEARNWHIVFYRATSQLTAREIEELWIERLPKFRKRYNIAALTPKTNKP